MPTITQPLPREPSFDDDGNLICEDEYECVSSSDAKRSTSDSLDERSDDDDDDDDDDV